MWRNVVGTLKKSVINAQKMLKYVKDGTKAQKIREELEAWQRTIDELESAMRWPPLGGA
jgi:hypothetical protein